MFKYTSFLIEIQNPASQVQNLIKTENTLIKKLDKFFYWINPINWFKDTWNWIATNLSSGNWDTYFIAFSIVAIWFIMLGSKSAKKILWWGWVWFWIIRAVAMYH